MLQPQTKNSGQVPIQTTPDSSVFDEELRSKIEENAMLHKKVNGLIERNEDDNLFYNFDLCTHSMCS